MMLYWIIGGVVWVACGVLVYGRLLAHWQREFPDTAWESRIRDQLFAFAYAVFGPAAVMLVLIGEPWPHGLMYRVLKEK